MSGLQSFEVLSKGVKVNIVPCLIIPATAQLSIIAVMIANGHSHRIDL
jgi:hypothetical protein